MSKNKVKVELFVPLGSCMCHYSLLVDKVSRTLANHPDSVEVQIKPNTSKEARKYGVSGSSCVVVNGLIKLSEDFDYEELEKAINENSGSST